MIRAVPTSPKLLCVTDLCKRFPHGKRTLLGGKRAEFAAVDGVSFELERGGSLGLVGESGSGKTTIAAMLVGLHRASSGSIQFDGVELTTLSSAGWRAMRRRIQMVFQDPFASLDPRQTAGEIVAEPLHVHAAGKPRERRLRTLALFEAVGLAPRHVNQYPHEFSGGQRQRIGIARALALEPELVVCDEPVSALDVSIRSQILNLLAELQERFALSYLFISHDLAAVRALCPRIAVLYLGRLVEVAPREELFARPQHPYTQALLAAVPRPDPESERRRERVLLRGEAPSLSAAPGGCAFHPRCPWVERVPDGRCARERPELRAASPAQGHVAACHALER